MYSYPIISCLDGLSLSLAIMGTRRSAFLVTLFLWIVCFKNILGNPLDEGGNYSVEIVPGASITMNQQAVTQILDSLQSIVDATIGSKCPEPYFALNSDCFFLNREKLPWAESEKACQQIGGHLADLEHPFTVLHYLRNRHIHKTEWNTFNFWVGGRKHETDITWQWESGHRVNISQVLRDLSILRGSCLLFTLNYPPLIGDYCLSWYPSLCQLSNPSENL